MVIWCSMPIKGIFSSDNLLVVRTGNHQESIYEKDNFIARMLARIADAVTA